MKEIEQKNLDIVKNDLRSLYQLYKDIAIQKEASILMMGTFQYIILICLEAINYIESKIDIAKVKDKLKYKKILESCRARIKPSDLNCDKIYLKSEKLNYKKMQEYSKYVKKTFRKIFKKVICNLGIYSYDDMIIGNTFLYEKIYKKIVYENGVSNGEKTKNVAQEVGEIIKELMYILDVPKEEVKQKNINNYNINSRDYNIYNDNVLFTKKYDKNVCLVLLDELSVINFYIGILSKMIDNTGLKYRIAYIIFDKTMKEITKINEKEHIADLEEISNKYNYLINSEFRNNMYHYNLENSLENTELRKNEVYLGLIQKYFGINETTFQMELELYMLDMSEKIKKIL